MPYAGFCTSSFKAHQDSSLIAFPPALSLWCCIFVVVTLADAIWLPSFFSFHCSQLPSLHPSVMSHSFSLLPFLFSLTPPPAACCFYVIFFPLKLLPSNAKINFPCPLHQCPPQPPPLTGDVKASSSLIQNLCPGEGSKAGEWSRKHVLGEHRTGSSLRNCFIFFFPPRHCTGLYVQTSVACCRSCSERVD